MAAKTLTIDGKPITAEEGATVLRAAEEAGIKIPTLCHLDGVYDVGACRLCLVEITGVPKLLPACTTRVAEGMDVRTDTERLRKYRRMTLELLFAERNHVCAACVSNGHCELQTLGYSLGMDHVRYDYQFPRWSVDTTHRLFGMDHNRCVLCTRCVRVCWHIEGAGTKNVAGRGTHSHIITDLKMPWGDSDSCTQCGKCVQACPTGALFHKGSTVGEMWRDRGKLEFIVRARESSNGLRPTDMKTRLATVWFGGCSGCHMSFLDLDEFLIDLVELVEIVYSPVIDTKEYPQNVDVCLIEGAICNEDNLELLHRIRERTKVLISFGDCAVTANVPAMRITGAGNVESVLQRAYIEHAQDNPCVPKADGIVPALLTRVRPVHEVVHVEHFLPGCPPPAASIKALVSQLLSGIEPKLVGKQIKFG